MTVTLELIARKIVSSKQFRLQLEPSPASSLEAAFHLGSQEAAGMGLPGLDPNALEPPVLPIRWQVSFSSTPTGRFLLHRLCFSPQQATHLCPLPSNRGG